MKLFLTHFRTEVYSIAPFIVVLAQLELGLCAIKDLGSTDLHNHIAKVDCSFAATFYHLVVLVL